MERRLPACRSAAFQAATQARGLRTGRPEACAPLHYAPMKPKQEIEKLRTELERHNRLYYIDAAPEISDYEFDQMLRRLAELEAKHPEYADPNSPTQRVGGAPIESFPTVIHDPPMLSIENAYNLDELREWDDRVRRGLGRDPVRRLVKAYDEAAEREDVTYEEAAYTAGASR